MGNIRFVWDNRKEKTNITKHGVSFEEATTVFFDEYAIEYYDPDHSDDEDRFILFGISRNLRVLVVCYCYRESDTIVRIISARKATRRESNNYSGKGRLIMRKEYDFSNMKGRKNPFAKKLKQQITIRIGVDTLGYFKELSKETGVPYQNLIDSYLTDCAYKHRKLQMKWA